MSDFTLWLCRQKMTSYVENNYHLIEIRAGNLIVNYSSPLKKILLSLLAKTDQVV